MKIILGGGLEYVTFGQDTESYARGFCIIGRRCVNQRTHVALVGHPLSGRCGRERARARERESYGSDTCYVSACVRVLCACVGAGWGGASFVVARFGLAEGDARRRARQLE